MEGEVQRILIESLFDDQGFRNRTPDEKPPEFTSVRDYF